MSEINVPDVPHAPRPPAPKPEEVTWLDLNGREPEAWEEDAIVAARMREREREWRP